LPGRGLKQGGRRKKKKKEGVRRTMILKLLYLAISEVLAWIYISEALAWIKAEARLG